MIKVKNLKRRVCISIVLDVCLYFSVSFFYIFNDLDFLFNSYINNCFAEININFNKIYPYRFRTSNKILCLLDDKHFKYFKGSLIDCYNFSFSGDSLLLLKYLEGIFNFTKYKEFENFLLGLKYLNEFVPLHYLGLMRFFLKNWFCNFFLFFWFFLVIFRMYYFFLRNFFLFLGILLYNNGNNKSINS